MLDQEYQKAGGSLESCRLLNPDSDHEFDVPYHVPQAGSASLGIWDAPDIGMLMPVMPSSVGAGLARTWHRPGHWQERSRAPQLQVWI